MAGTELTAEDDSEGHFVISEEAIKLLPEEWQNEIIARAEDGRMVLETVDKEITQLERLSKSFYNVTILKYIRDQLSAFKFRPTMEAILELDMLTTAFVATYVRLFTGGNSSGFARDNLPEGLRAAHDEIIEIRNKRYAHTDDHGSVKDEMRIQEGDGGSFVVHLSISYSYYIGGSNEWTKLVDCLDDLFANRGDKIIDRLKQRTGREWSLARGEAPTSEGS
jgi:hypothetical protein